MTDTPCFGIDLGTTCSSIGLVEAGSPRLIAVEGDSALLPSVISFPPGQPALVGAPAVNRLPLDPERTIRSAKRHMGTDHTWTIDGRAIGPVEVGTRVIERLLDAAEADTGLRPRRAVITVPAWFTQAQRADTRRAGEAAGLSVERVINEPTAAALAHAQGQEVRRLVMVYDLGGGTFDVSVVEQDGPLLEVRASHGDSRLGGDDIDLAFTDYVLRRLATEDPALREVIEGSQAARVRLRAAVEEAKVALSEVREATLRAPFLAEGADGPLHLEMRLQREELVEVAAPWIERTLESVERVLSDAKLDPQALDELLLVGGATQMPLVWSALRDAYGLEGSHAIPPRTAVALGAAIQGAIVDGSRIHGVLVDVAPYSLSVGAASGLVPGHPTHFTCKVLTPRNTPLPSRHTEIFTTHTPYQEEVRVPVFQGGHLDPRRNVLLGIVEISGLAPAPEGRFSRPVAVAFRHDLDGLVSVTVTEELSGKRGQARMAVDGEAQAELWEELEVLMEDLIPGDGSEPEGEEARGEARGGGEIPAVTGDIEGARRSFEAVLSAGDALDNPALLALAREGLEALERGDDAAALEGYDALSDRMFEEGIFL